MSVVDASRIAFATSEYRSTVVEDSAVKTRHPLASELVFSSLIKNESDAITFGTTVLGLRKLDRWSWTCLVTRNDYPNLEVGQTITITYPRFSLSAGKNFIVKRLKIDANSPYYELDLFGPQ